MTLINTIYYIILPPINLLSNEGIGGHGGGKGYHPSTIKLSKVAQSFGGFCAGSCSKNLLSRNLASPILNTSSRIFKKEIFLYNRLEQRDPSASITLSRRKTSWVPFGPISFKCAADETKYMELAPTFWKEKHLNLSPFLWVNSA